MDAAPLLFGAALVAGAFLLGRGFRCALGSHPSRGALSCPRCGAAVVDLPARRKEPR